jgi:hypothetical protein
MSVRGRQLAAPSLPATITAAQKLLGVAGGSGQAGPPGSLSPRSRHRISMTRRKIQRVNAPLGNHKCRYQNDERTSNAR